MTDDEKRLAQAIFGPICAIVAPDCDAAKRWTQAEIAKIREIFLAGYRAGLHDGGRVHPDDDSVLAVAEVAFQRWLEKMD